MGFLFENSGIAASIYLALYTLYTMITVYIFIRKGWKHIYTFLMFFGLIRLASQLCGVVFSVLGLNHWQWLIAYLVLGAEGYFVLIYTSFRFICNAQKKEFGVSWLLTSGPKFSSPIKRALFGKWVNVFHHVLLPANALVIAGGSMLASINTAEYSENSGRVTTSKILRTIGQAIFLTMTTVMISLNFNAYFREKIRNHITISIFLASPFLLVRGIFGILSIYITDMNYFQLTNYSGNGFSSKLLVYEYVLATTMEFVAALFLLSNYFLSGRGLSNDAEAVRLSRKSEEL